MSMPKQSPGRSKQNYGTPLDFMAAIARRLDIEEFAFDFAADEFNTKAPYFFEEKDDALVQRWAPDLIKPEEWAWCNPPYGNIGPWAEKCMKFGYERNVALLVPASIGSNWFRDFVDGDALVLALNGRLTFEGCTAPYPKDVICCLYGPGIDPAFEVWDWRKA